MTLPRSVTSLRRSIVAVDRRLQAAIAERFRLARAIADSKVRWGLSLRDFPVEREVIARWRTALSPERVPTDWSEAIARGLIEESLRQQERVLNRSRRAPARTYDIAIVGGSGAMGRWLGRFFEDFGQRIGVVDPRKGPSRWRSIRDVETAARRADVVVFATPIRRTPSLYRRALAAEPSALLLDILSVKSPIAPMLRAAARDGRLVSSVHPLFGPSARALSGRNLLIVSCGVARADELARALFASSALSISQVPLDQHDRLIARSLGLSHAINLLFLSVVGAGATSAEEFAHAASTTFRRVAALARDVAGEGPELYLDIQSLNTHSRGMYDELHQALHHLEEVVAARDLGRFRDLVEAGVDKLDSVPRPTFD